jgi:CDP-diacylglycerol---glycerol-3-phosphate 3-phosphatidyltransferase
MANLRRSWSIWFGVCIVGSAVAAATLSQIWGWNLSLRWLIPAGGLLLYQLLYLYRFLGENRNLASGVLYDRLGPGNWLTIFRGASLAMVAGFLLIPQPEGWVAWMPAVLYLAAMLIDYVDGYAARISNTVTRLGSRLDMHFDVHGYIIGGLLIVLWGQAPVWYLLVALARPLYVVGEWLYAKQQKNLRPLYPNPFRRALSGAQMGFTAVLLFPLFKPPATTIAAALYMLPFLTTFLLDWLWVSGVLPESFVQLGERRTRLLRFTKEIFPLLLRTVLIGLLIMRAEQPGAAGTMAGLFTVLHAVAILAFLTGSAGRMFAVGVMLLSGLYLRIGAGDLLAWGMLFTSLGLFFSGTGRFSLWTPEDWLIYYVAGEKANV